MKKDCKCLISPTVKTRNSIIKSMYPSKKTIKLNILKVLNICKPKYSRNMLFNASNIKNSKTRVNPKAKKKIRY